MVEDLGGGINQVVRVGDTVRRPTGPWSPSVHELLTYLETAGFPGAPRFLGIDEEGRESLTLISGVVAEPLLCDSALLNSAATLLRDYHDTVAGWSPTTAVWQVAPVSVGAPEVICHNDLAPWNLLTRDGRAVAFVDWDTAAPGPRMWDLAYLAYRLVPLSAPENLPLMGWPENGEPVAERLAALRRGYRCTTEQWQQLVALLPRRIRAAYDTTRIWAAEGRPGWRAQWEQPEPWRHGAGFLRDLVYVRDVSDSLPSWP